MSACTEHREGVEDVGLFPAALGSDQTACPGTPVLAWWPVIKNKIRQFIYSALVQSNQCKVKHGYSKYPYNEIAIISKSVLLPKSSKCIINLLDTINSFHNIAYPSLFANSVFFCVVS